MNFGTSEAGVDACYRGGSTGSADGGADIERCSDICGYGGRCDYSGSDNRFPQ